MPDVFQSFTIEQVASVGIALLIIFSGIVSVLFVIWGGFLMIISGGNEEKVKGAINHMRYAFIGLVFIVAMLFIFPTFLDLLGVEYGEYMRPQTIFDTISGLSDSIFGQQVEVTPFPDSTSQGELPADFSDF